MNIFYVIITSVFLTLAMSIPYDAIEKSFEKNDASAIVNLGEEKILVDILGKEGVYSKSQAGLVLKDFFSRKPGNSFDFVFKGKETAQGAFAIGNYTSRKEKFRVTIHFKKHSEKYKIESLSIESN